MNIPKNDREIIRKMMILRIEILPKEAPLGLKSPTPSCKNLRGGGPGPHLSKKGCETKMTWRQGCVTQVTRLCYSGDKVVRLRWPGDKVV